MAEIFSALKPNTSPDWRQERGWVLDFGVLVMLITSLPYLAGFACQGEAFRFTGFVFGVEDGNSYIAKMLAGATGDWLFRTPYSIASERGVLIYLPYLLLGKLASPPGIHEQLVALFHLFRFISGLLLVLASYEFLAFFLKQRRVRRLGLVLVTLGGGLGWVFVTLRHPSWLGSLPLDFYSPESFGFLSLYGIPHLALGRALMLWALLAYLRFVQDGGDSVPFPLAVLKLSLLWLGAGFMQPLLWVLIGFLIVLHLFGWLCMGYCHRYQELVPRRAYWKRSVFLTALAGILPGILSLLTVWEVLSDPFMAMWAKQNIVRSPHPLHYLLAYGVLLPYALIGARKTLLTEPLKGWLPIGWVLALPLLAYAPLNLQRRLPDGIWVAWCCLAMLALERFSSATKVRKLAILPLILLFPSTLFLLVGGWLTAITPNLPVFRPVDEVRVFQFLAENTPKGEVVLSSYETGNALPAWAAMRVVIGHGPESANLSELKPLVTQFYAASTADAMRLEWLQRWRVRYVFWGPAEHRLGDWDPHQAGFLELVYQAGEYLLFKVKE